MNFSAHHHTTRTVRLHAARWLTALLLLALPGRAAAQDPPPATLEQWLTEAHARNPALRAAREEAAASRQRIAQAWALPDPSFGTMVMGDMLETRVGPQEHVYEVEQLVPFPGKLWQQRAIAKAEAAAQATGAEGVAQDVARDIATAYYDLYAVDATIRDVEDILEQVKQFEQIAQSRYASQGGGQREVAKAQVEVSQTLERLFVLRQQRDTLIARVNALLGRREDTPIGPVAEPSRPQLTGTLEELLARARTGRPEVRQAEALVSRARHAKRLAGFETLPDVSVGFRYVDIGNGTTTQPNDGQDAWMIPLMIRVPLWANRTIPAIREAAGSLRAREASLEDAENRTAFEVRDRYYRVVTAARLVELYENALIPEAELAFRSDYAGYEAGRQDALNVIDSERTYLNAKIAYYQTLADYLKQMAELERAVGQPLAPAHAGDPS